ncbi:hypothetical protein MMUC44124_20775 [Mycolicibacterium mucogenicum DSM 44124]|nr:hypothetical protein MMUC44124_20775 [Mycolicibacterium mucogenicum DSM 44124]
MRMQIVDGRLLVGGVDMGDIREFDIGERGGGSVAVPAPRPSNTPRP